MQDKHENCPTDPRREYTPNIAFYTGNMYTRNMYTGKYTRIYIQETYKHHKVEMLSRQDGLRNKAKVRFSYSACEVLKDDTDGAVV